MRVLITESAQSPFLVLWCAEKGHEVYYTGVPQKNIPGTNIQPPIPWGKIKPQALIDTGEVYSDKLQNLWLNSTLELYKHAINHKVKVIAFASTAEVYGDSAILPAREAGPFFPLNFYAHTKLCLEAEAMKLSQDSKTKLIALRLGEVYSLNGGSIASIFQGCKNRNCVLPNPGDQLRDFVHICDVAQAFELAIRFDRSDTFNIGSGRSISFNDAHQIMSKILKRRKKPSYAPVIDGFQQDQILDIGRAKRCLEYLPKVQIETAIEAMA